MSRRVEQLNSSIREHVATAIIRELKNGLEGITVTAVDVAPDVKSAIVWVSVYGQMQDIVWAELQAAVPAISRYVGSKLTTKFTPRLNFKRDASEGYADHINRLMKGI